MDWAALASVLLEPIAVAGWLLLVLSVLLAFRPQAGAARGLCWALTAAYFAVGSPLGANQLVGVLEDRARQEADCAPPPAGSVIVVLAGGVSGEPDDPGAYERLSESSLRRTIPATKLGLAVPASTIVTAGGRGGAAREADLMASLAADLGFPAARIMRERESRTTIDSARRTATILRDLGARPAYLVTSAIHMPRARAVFRGAGLVTCAWPVDFRRVYPPWPEALVPQITAVRKSAEALHEMVGHLGYWALGRTSSRPGGAS